MARRPQRYLERMSPTRCRACGAPIIFGVTVRGKSLPLDAEPNSKGNVWFGDDGKLVVGGDPAPSRLRYMAHWATCPKAASFRRPREKAR